MESKYSKEKRKVRHSRGAVVVTMGKAMLDIIAFLCA